MSQQRVEEPNAWQTPGRHALRVEPVDEGTVAGTSPGLDSLVASAPRGSTSGAGATDGVGEVELVARVRAGDDDALLVLLERHRPALERAGQQVTIDSLSRAARGVARWLRAAPERTLPFRAALLAHHLRGDAPTLPYDDPLWRGYAALPEQARVALWHREVEGERVSRIGAHLALPDAEVGEALGTAYAALRRRVALDHALDGGADDACRRWVELFRFSPPSALSRAQAHDLRANGDACAACAPLAASVLAVDHGLARTLALPVLGPLADSYLAARPRRARLRPVAAPGAVPSHRSRRPGPLRAGGSFSLVGAGSIALLLATPGSLHNAVPEAAAPSSTTGVVVGAAEAGGDQPTARTRAGRAADARTGAGQPGVRAGGPGTAAGGPGTLQPGQPGQSDQPGQQEPPGDEGRDPGTPATPTEPTAPTGPGSPTGPTAPAPGQPSPPAGDSGSLDIDLGDGGVVVTVDPQLPTGPIQVELPLPLDLSGLPDVPALPALPGAGGAGKLAGAPVGGALQPGLY